MASRDLTAAFLEKRSAASLRRRSESANGGESTLTKLTAGGSDDGHALMLMEDGEGIQMSNLGGGNGLHTSAPPIWVDTVDAIHNEISEIQRFMDKLTSLHASRVGSVFGKDLQDMEGQIEHLTQDITDKFRTVERMLTKVGAATKRAGGQEATIGANVQRNLAKQLQQLSVTFRQSQRKYLAEVQAQKQGGDDKFGIDLNAAADGDFFTTQQVQVVDNLQEAIQSRDQEIAKIAQSIEELGTIFKELAVLVIDQGTILDRIDYNMEAVVEHTKTGIQQLEKAEKSQKNARPQKCIFCLVALICALLLILIFKHKMRRWV
eukprot:CAMPEP_0198111386 /NCGR_PEP_ID=MMETSP1442-20131203/3341_1 /TAXON_ID= /ORGANISM="Craspedostauros australis, Strain CCMP3328" /LENGTH=319 /DNA_ID=CAMNT_0043767789 /DNA_START=89 /DNA_END=1048 /DNA_ORIENTATION=+